MKFKLLFIKIQFYLNHLCVRFASSVGRASEQRSEGRGFESHMRLTLYLESNKPEHSIEYHMYPLILHYILINLKEKGKCSDR